MENIFSADSDLLNQYIIPWGLNIIFALITYIIGRWLVKLITKAIKRLMEKSGIDVSLRDFLGNLINVALTIVVIIAALEQLGVDTTSVLAVFAAAGLAVGLALKDSLSNFSAGVMLIFFKPFKVGDVINAAGVIGGVESIGIFNTTMKTGDNQEIIVPNSSIYGGTITNITKRDTRRIDLVIGIGYDDDIKKAKSLLENLLKENAGVLEEPAPTILVLELGESSIDLAVRPWAKTADYWVVRSELLQTIKETFDANGISIPYPQRDLHLIDAPPSLQVAK